jgi:hypothetical protein
MPAKPELGKSAKVLEKGLGVLAKLFPGAGWERFGAGMDFYPYFADVLDLKKNSAILSPFDPAQTALALARIAGELLVGFRSIQFGVSFGTDDCMGPILEHWPRVLEENFYGSYIPKIDEYASLFEPSRAGRAKTTYAMNLANDIHWMRRYYFFPHYEYKSGIPPSFSRKDVASLYALARELRRALTDIAEEIDAVKKNGGTAAGAVYLKMRNAEAPYHFEIENPLSKRLNLILPKQRRTNVSLIFFTLAVSTVLDEYVNNPASLAYGADKEVFYRCLEGGGREPVLWVEKRADVETLLRRPPAARKETG